MASRIHNAKGFSLLMAVVFLGFVTTVMAVFYPMMSRYLMKSKQMLNVRAEFEVAETMIRMLLASPATYTCTSQGGVPNCGFQGNITRPAPLNQIRAPMVADVIASAMQRIACIQGQNCTVTIQDGGTIHAGSPRHTTLVYNIDMREVGSYQSTIDVPLPVMGLLDKMTPCNGIMTGIDSNGSPICVAIPTTRARIGEYISGINPITYAVTISPVPPPVNDCLAGPDQFIMTYEWSGGSNYRVTCHSRLDPAVFQ